jgi:hypothetical protein
MSETDSIARMWGYAATFGLHYTAEQWAAVMGALKTVTEALEQQVAS